MPRAKPVSNRQRSLQRKASAAAPRAKPALAVVQTEGEPSGSAARDAIRHQLRQQVLTQRGDDLAVAVALGNMTPAQAKAEVEVELVRANDLPGVPFRVSGRDGLVSLHRSRALSDLQLKAGLAFRLSYEASSAGVGSCLGRAGEGGGSRKLAALGRSAAELHRAYLLARLNQMERAVAGAMVDGRELHALRMIAGEGRTVYELAGKSGHSRDAYKGALGRALDAVVEALRITGS